MSEIILEKARRGGYRKRVEVELRPPEEVRTGMGVRYTGKFEDYYSVYDMIKAAMRDAPEDARGILWQAATRLYRLNREGKIAALKADYATYLKILRTYGADEYLDQILQMLHVYEIIKPSEAGRRTREPVL